MEWRTEDYIFRRINWRKTMSTIINLYLYGVIINSILVVAYYIPLFFIQQERLKCFNNMFFNFLKAGLIYNHLLEKIEYRYFHSEEEIREINTYEKNIILIIKESIFIIFFSWLGSPLIFRKKLIKSNYKSMFPDYINFIGSYYIPNNEKLSPAQEDAFIKLKYSHSYTLHETRKAISTLLNIPIIILGEKEEIKTNIQSYFGNQISLNWQQKKTLLTDIIIILLEHENRLSKKMFGTQHIDIVSTFFSYIFNLLNENNHQILKVFCELYCENDMIKSFQCILTSSPIGNVILSNLKDSFSSIYKLIENNQKNMNTSQIELRSYKDVILVLLDLQLKYISLENKSNIYNQLIYKKYSSIYIDDHIIKIDAEQIFLFYKYSEI